MAFCNDCPRNCNADRSLYNGFCKAGEKVKISKAYLHLWEEPCISGEKGSGTVFFSGCNLKCCFCQNYKISSENFGKEISDEKLSEIFLELQEKGANNINLVTPSHFTKNIINALKMVKNQLFIPIVYNTSGYDKEETIEMLDEYVDIYLTDIKFYDNELSKKYLKCPDYFDVIKKALKKMIETKGKPLFESGLLKKGVIIRHLVMPSYYRDSVNILDYLNENYEKDDFMLSIMSQYVPFYKSMNFPEINRKITTYEYNKVMEKVEEYKFLGYFQQKTSAKEDYIPDFDLSGIDF